jgi:Cathepsin propeptide inhibitor domain (I29)
VEFFHPGLKIHDNIYLWAIFIYAMFVRRRRETFKQHLHLIMEHNLEADLGDHRFTLGINEFADWVMYNKSNI